jgi:dsRNA-specific ribonuclease
MNMHKNIELICQKYKDISSDNDKLKFKISCEYGNMITFGYGNNKKDAKKNSAELMYKSLNI